MRLPLIRWKRSISTCCGRPARWRRTCARSYDEFAFHKIYHRVNHFCIVDLSAFYFDVLKDRLYISAPKSQARRSAQTAIWRIGEALTRLLAPILSFTCEEIWQYLPKIAGREESVHLAKFPASADILGGSAAAIEFQVRRRMEDFAGSPRRSAESARSGAQHQVDRNGPRSAGGDHGIGSCLFAAAASRRGTALSVHRFGR